MRDPNTVDKLIISIITLPNVAFISSHKPKYKTKIKIRVKPGISKI